MKHPLLEVAKKTLEDNGYRVLTARDGTEGLAVYAEHKKKIDAVVMDMVMPYLDGPATIRAIQRLNPEVKIIASSGLSANDKTFEAANEGRKDILEEAIHGRKVIESAGGSARHNLAIVKAEVILDLITLLKHLVARPQSNSLLYRAPVIAAALSANMLLA